jgi:hypothetical protein
MLGSVKTLTAQKASVHLESNEASALGATASANDKNISTKKKSDRQQQESSLDAHIYDKNAKNVGAGETGAGLARATTLSNQIYFDYRALNFGSTVLRTSTRKRIALVNDSLHEAVVVLSLPAGRGFQIVFNVNVPAMEKESFQRFHVEPKTQLVIPVRFRPLLLGTSVCMVMGKVIVEGRKHMRVVCALEGKGI